MPEPVQIADDVREAIQAGSRALVPEFVSGRAALEDLARRLAVEPVVALDTESNSFHAYRERVCLIRDLHPRCRLHRGSHRRGRRAAGRGAGGGEGTRAARRRLRRPLPAARVRVGPGSDLRHHGGGATSRVEGTWACRAGSRQLRRAPHQGAPARRLGAPAPHPRATPLRGDGYPLPAATPRDPRRRPSSPGSGGRGPPGVRQDRLVEGPRPCLRPGRLAKVEGRPGA